MGVGIFPILSFQFPRASANLIINRSFGRVQHERLTCDLFKGFAAGFRMEAYVARAGMDLLCFNFAELFFAAHARSMH